MKILKGLKCAAAGIAELEPGDIESPAVPISPWLFGEIVNKIERDYPDTADVGVLVSVIDGEINSLGRRRFLGMRGIVRGQEAGPLHVLCEYLVRYDGAGEK